MSNWVLPIKQYTIQPIGAHALRYSVFDLPPEQCVLIICCDRSGQFPYPSNLRHVLEIVFPDYEDRRLPGAFDKVHARKIICFITELPDMVSDIYVCCAKGGSRSPAVAAALLRASGRPDRDIWCNPFYVPNTLVYLRLCQEFGLKTSILSVWIRVWINNRAFKKAQKNKGSAKYERWQIL